MNQLRVITRQERPDLKSIYDPFIYRRRGAWIEIEPRGRAAVLQVLDKDGNPLNIDIIHMRPLAVGDIEKLIASVGPVTNDQAEQMRLAREDILRHGPHRLDPTKPLIDEAEDGP